MIWMNLIEIQYIEIWPAEDDGGGIEDDHGEGGDYGSDPSEDQALDYVYQFSRQY